MRRLDGHTVQASASAIVAIDGMSARERGAQQVRTGTRLAGVHALLTWTKIQRRPHDKYEMPVKRSETSHSCVAVC